MVKARRFCFTINDYDFGADNGAGLITALPKGVRYVIWQHEKVAHDHLQGYIRFENTTSHGTLIQLLGHHAHYETAKGTEAECKAYCSKPESRVAGPWEFGVPLQEGESKGTRTDLRSLAEKIQKKEFSAVADADSGAAFLKYGRNIEALAAKVDLQTVPLRDSVQVGYIWGPSGIGKSQIIWDAAEASGMLQETYQVTYPTKGQTFWFPGYTGQKILLLDEFSDEKLTVTVFNQLVDPHPYKVRTGTTDWRWARWEKVIILSNHPPQDLYCQENQMAKDSFIRRTTTTGTTIRATTRDDLKDQIWPAGLEHRRWT